MGMKPLSFLIVVSLLAGAHPDTPFAQEREEETYSISLVQTAETEKQVKEVDDKKVLTETHTIREGDHLWQLLRERGLLQKRNLPELLSILKRLNSSLTNLDLIHPGERIVIPLTIAPVQGTPTAAKKAIEIPMSIEDLKEIKLEDYRVVQGDSLIKVVKSRYDIPHQDLHDEYLDLVRRLNPSISDLNVLRPGQIVRLPIYSPQVVRMPVKKAPPPPPTPASEPEAEIKAEKRDLGPLNQRLGEVFSRLGEQWITAGQHFIPLKSGGQVNLKAESFPVLNLTNGNHIIVDLYHELPEKMAQLITSNWDTYRIVPLGKEEDLRGALGKILSQCGYQRIYGPGEPFDMGGEILVRVTADWIIQAVGGADQKPRIFVITFMDEATPGTPPEIQEYLKGRNITVIDYPSTKEPEGKPPEESEILTPGKEPSELLETLLRLTGAQFTGKVEIPMYQGENSKFSLIVKADFLLNIDGKKCIIDLTGLGPEVLSLLKEQGYQALSLAAESDPFSILAKTLPFIGVKHSQDPHDFPARGGDTGRNITITIPGILFTDQKGEKIFATRLRLPAVIATFLSRKGYRIMSLASF